jgi:hypothetical protein
MKLKDITKTLKIGIVGYSAQEFNRKKAEQLIRDGIEEILKSNKSTYIDIVSGLTNIGIPALAYNYAVKKRYMTTGIACTKAEEYECFPVDTKIIVGEEWGDESETFLRHIDCLLRIGGGKQSIEETETFKKLKPDNTVVEYELEAMSKNDQ